MKTQTRTRTIPKTPFFAAFSVGAVLFSAHAGGGFATGNQANTYYVGLGWAGIVSAIVAMLLLTLTMREAMIMYNSRGLTSYKQLFETAAEKLLLPGVGDVFDMLEAVKAEQVVDQRSLDIEPDFHPAVIGIGPVAVGRSAVRDVDVSLCREAAAALGGEFAAPAHDIFQHAFARSAPPQGVIRPAVGHAAKRHIEPFISFEWKTDHAEFVELFDFAQNAHLFSKYSIPAERVVVYNIPIENKRQQPGKDYHE